MANEFIIKNGFHSKGDSELSGSLTFNPGDAAVATIGNYSSDGSIQYGLLNISASGMFLLNQLHVGDPDGNYFLFDPGTKRFDAPDFGAKFLNVTASSAISASGLLFASASEGYPHTTLNVIAYDTASGQFYYTGSTAIGSGTPTLQQVTTAGNTTSNPIIIGNGRISDSGTGRIIIDGDFDDETASGLAGVDLKAQGNTLISVFTTDGNNTPVQIKTNTAVTGSITGDTSLNITGDGGISSSAGLIFRGNSISKNIITTPNSSDSGNASNVIYIQPGNNASGTGGIGAHIYLRGADQSNASGLDGGNVYIGGGNHTNTSRASGSVYLDGKTIEIGNTSGANTPLHAENISGSIVTASIFTVETNPLGDDHTSRLNLNNSTLNGVSLNGSAAAPVILSIENNPYFTIKKGGSPYVATLSGSGVPGSTGHSRMIATSGSFSEITGNSPLKINVGSDTLQIVASNFTVATTGEISSGTGDGISTTSVTASADISSSGKFIGSELSSLGDLTLDADGADILLKDGGTEFGRFKRDSSNFVIKSATSDKDIIFKGDSGGGTVTSLTLDMSDAGSATFNNNITASGDISLPNSGQSINFISNAGIYGRTGGSYPGLHIASGTSTSARIWIGNAFNTTGAVTASFLGLGQISNVHTIEPHGNYPLILRGGKGPNDANDGIQMFTGDASNVYQKRFEIEADGTNVDAYFTNINGFGINKTSGFAAELDVNGDINASGDITSSKFLGDNFVKSGGTSAQFLKADGSVDSSTYSTATGVENNADVTDATNVAAAGALMASNNLSDVSNAETSRDNLGLGSFATISSLAFSSLTGKPTTIAGYGITDALELGVTSNTALAGDTTVGTVVTGNGGGTGDTLSSISIGGTNFTVATGTGNGTVTSIGGTGTVSGLTLTGTVTTSGNLTLGGTLSVDLTSDVTGVLPSANMDSDTAHLTGTQTFSGAKTFSSGITISGNNYINFAGSAGGGGEGIRFLDGSDGNREALHFPGNDLVVLSNRSQNGIVEIRSNTSTVGSSGETLSARFTATGSFVSKSLEIDGSGSGIFSVEGSVGTLFSVDDGLDDVIFAANNISGTPVISANADNTVKLGKLGGFGIVISGSTPAPSDDDANIIITGSIEHKGTSAYFNSAMIVGSGTAANTTNGKIVAANDVVAFSSSDRRWKENVKPIENALDKVLKIGGYEFDWKELTEEEKKTQHSNEGHDVGVIAQEIEEVLPEVVTTRENGYKGVKYEKIIPLLVEAIKELQEEINDLKKDK